MYKNFFKQSQKGVESSRTVESILNFKRVGCFVRKQAQGAFSRGRGLKDNQKHCLES